MNNIGLVKYNTLLNIGDAIRETIEEENKYLISEMPDKIRSISPMNFDIYIQYLTNNKAKIICNSASFYNFQYTSAHKFKKYSTRNSDTKYWLSDDPLDILIKYTNIIFNNEAFSGQVNSINLSSMSEATICDTINFNVFCNNNIRTLNFICTEKPFDNYTKTNYPKLHQLENVNLINEDKMSYIPKYLFYNSSLTEISIPETVTKIGKGAFGGCNKLKKIYIDTLEHWFNIEFENSESNPLCNGGILYTTKDNKEHINLQIPETFNRIPNYCFCGSGISTLDLNNVKEIGKYAFYNCKKLVSVSNSNNVQRFEEGCFENVDRLYESSLNINDNSYIGKNAFLNVPNIIISDESNLYGAVCANGTIVDRNKVYKNDKLLIINPDTIILEINTPTILQASFSNLYKLQKIIFNSPIEIAKTVEIRSDNNSNLKEIEFKDVCVMHTSFSSLVTHKINFYIKLDKWCASTFDKAILNEYIDLIINEKILEDLDVTMNIPKYAFFNYYRLKNIIINRPCTIENYGFRCPNLNSITINSNNVTLNEFSFSNDNNFNTNNEQLYLNLNCDDIETLQINTSSDLPMNTPSHCFWGSYNVKLNQNDLYINNMGSKYKKMFSFITSPCNLHIDNEENSKTFPTCFIENFIGLEQVFVNYSIDPEKENIETLQFTFDYWSFVNCPYLKSITLSSDINIFTSFCNIYGYCCFQNCFSLSGSSFLSYKKTSSGGAVSAQFWNFCFLHIPEIFVIDQHENSEERTLPANCGAYNINPSESTPVIEDNGIFKYGENFLYNLSFNKTLLINNTPYKANLSFFVNFNASTNSYFEDLNSYFSPILRYVKSIDANCDIEDNSDIEVNSWVSKINQIETINSSGTITFGYPFGIQKSTLKEINGNIILNSVSSTYPSFYKCDNLNLNNINKENYNTFANFRTAYDNETDYSFNYKPRVCNGYFCDDIVYNNIDKKEIVACRPLCSNIITIDENVENIIYNSKKNIGAFEGCQLNTIKLNNNLKNIEKQSFYNCINLENIYYSDDPIILEENAFSNTNNNKINIFLNNLYSYYYSNDYYNDFKIENSYRKWNIANWSNSNKNLYLFNKYTDTYNKLKTIFINEKYINRGMFYKCNLDKIIISKKLEEIMDYGLYLNSNTSILYEGTKKEWEQINIFPNNFIRPEQIIYDYRIEEMEEYKNYEQYINAKL